MSRTMPAEPEDLLRRAAREPLLPADERGPGQLLDRSALEAMLPHRGSFLLIDRVTVVDLGRMLTAARYDLARGAEVFRDHFPGSPVWPGVLQIEAIGQAGAVLFLTQPRAPCREVSARPRLTLTHVTAAKFLRPITPEGDIEILAHGWQDGLFISVIGQCLHRGAICSVAAVKALID